MSKKTVLIISIFAILYSACSDYNEKIIADEDIESVSFNAMSFNISGITFAQNKDSITALILRNDVNLIGVQELNGSNKTELISLLGNNFSLIETFPTATTQNSHPIIYNNQSFLLIDSGYFETQLCRARRFINWALVEKKNTKKLYYFYNNHLCRGDEELKKQHLIDLTNLMNLHYNETEYYAIVVGDFNSNESSANIQYLLGNQSLTLAQNNYNNPIPLVDTWSLANPGITKPSQRNTSIDWIFSTSNIEVIDARVDLSGVNTQGEYPSDHSPVVCELK
jgi:exonuclease III